MVSKGGRIMRSDLNGILPKDSTTHVAIQHLIDDKCIKENPNGSSYYDIISNGTRIQGNGGYKEEFNRKRLADELKSRIDKSILDTNDSVKKTNESIQTLNDTILPENFKSQDKFGTRSLWLTFISVFFIGVTAYLQYRDKTAQRVEELKQEVKETSKTLKELQSSLKEVNSSIQKIKTDTVFVKQE